MLLLITKSNVHSSSSDFISKYILQSRSFHGQDVCNLRYAKHWSSRIKLLKNYI